MGDLWVTVSVRRSGDGRGTPPATLPPPHTRFRFHYSHKILFYSHLNLRGLMFLLPFSLLFSSSSTSTLLVSVVALVLIIHLFNLNVALIIFRLLYIRIFVFFLIFSEFSSLLIRKSCIRSESLLPFHGFQCLDHLSFCYSLLN